MRNYFNHTLQLWVWFFPALLTIIAVILFVPKPASFQPLLFVLLLLIGINCIKPKHIFYAAGVFSLMPLATVLVVNTSTLAPAFMNRTAMLAALWMLAWLLYKYRLRQDIAEQTVVERTGELHTQESRFRNFVDNSPAGYFFVDCKGLFQYVNAAWLSMHGYETAEEVVGKHFSLTQVDIDIEKAQQVFEQLLEGKPIPAGEFSRKNKDGSIGYHLFTIHPVDADGDVIGLEGFLLDTTERKRVEQQLIMQTSLLQSTLDSTTDGVLVTDLQNNNIIYNTQFLQMWHFEEENGIATLNNELFENALTQLVDPEKIRIKVAYLFEHPEENSFDVMHFKDGRIFERYSQPQIMEGEIVGRIWSFRDVTERERNETERLQIENQLQQAQRMESIGRLAGGVAHDFNNILAGILGYAEILSDDYPDIESDAGNAVSMIITGVERASDLTQQLLGFARGGKYSPLPLNVHDLLQKSVNVSEKIFEKNIAIQFSFNADECVSEADENQLHQVFANLLINAKDSMPKGGSLTITTDTVWLDQAALPEYQNVQEGRYLKVSLRDTGFGIAEDQLPHIFEPFYTTKAPGEGTGLGLAMVYGIVKHHHGFIFCESKLNVGTTFTILLPTTQKPVREAPGAVTLQKGDATILVVDDEDMLRNSLQQLLESLGYTVLTACDGIEAIEIYTEHQEAVDMVLLDMIMPRMAGKDTYYALHGINPEIKVLLMSGYSQDERASEVLRDGARGFISKPFDLSTLSTTIQQMIID
jgi:two-component system, cell cycle sensor histidine kinase and response regulator CckA